MRSSSEKKLIILTVIVVVIIISIAAFIAYAFLSNGNNSSENNMNFQLYNESNSKPTVNTENNIQEIATDCGFDDNNYFSKLFKRHYHSVIMSNSKTSEHIYPVTHEDTGNTHLDHR